MDEGKFVAPTFRETAFNCPLCGAFAHQEWGSPELLVGNVNYGRSDDYMIARCRRCTRYSVWVQGRQVYPSDSSNAPSPSPDLPSDAKLDYEEAASILSLSPRGSAALLRLAIQDLCKALGKAGRDLNADIGSLVQDGLPVRVQQALDVVRVVGNNAVHPGQIDLRDDTGTAVRLFTLVNLVADAMITQPKAIENMWNDLPESQRNQVAKRDSGTN